MGNKFVQKALAYCNCSMTNNVIAQCCLSMSLIMPMTTPAYTYSKIFSMTSHLLPHLYFIPHILPTALSHLAILFHL